MKKSRHRTDQIIENRRQADIAIGKGQKVQRFASLWRSRRTLTHTAPLVTLSLTDDGTGPVFSSVGQAQLRRAEKSTLRRV